MFDFADKARRLRRLRQSLPRKIAREAMYFFLNNWTRQGFLDDNLSPWQKRKGGREPKRPILYLTGRLKRGTKIGDINFGHITIVNDTPYAWEHNEGKNGQAKRKFIGNSVRLEKQLGDMVENAYDRIIMS